MTRWLLILAAAIAINCVTPAPAQGELEQHIVDVTTAGWVGVGLPEPAYGCFLDAFTVVKADTIDLYHRRCPPNSWACYWRPVAVVHPDADAAMVDRLAVHELLHELVMCNKMARDGYDYHHADERVWMGTGSSAEDIARSML